VRADPVFSAPGHVLGFVVIATDMQQRKQADRARRRFQEQVLEQRRAAPSLLPDDEASNAGANHLPLWTLLSSIVENAQLAALEITDGVEVGRMPAMLDSVKVSVDRSAELLRLLVQHAASTTRH
jgi:two-component system, chemotaxis family, sensor kinase Cph1